MSRSLQLLLPAAALVLVGCGGGGNNPPAPANIAPTITTQPQSQTIEPGRLVTFSVQATGTPTPTYQWKRNGSAMPGATQSSLSFTSADSDDQAEYFVTVSNAAGSVDSQKAVLTVRKVLAITSQPTAIDAVEGQPMTLAVLASGTDVKYQWYRNDTAIQGATASTLPFTAAKLTDAGTYHVVVTDSYKATITSTKVPVTVKAPSTKLSLTAQDALSLEEAGGYMSNHRFTATLPVTVNRGGLTGPVTLSIHGAPTGLNAAFNQVTLAADQSETLLSLAATAALPRGTYQVFVKASCAGEAILRPLTLTITQPTFDYQLAWINGTSLHSMQYLYGNVGQRIQRDFAAYGLKETAADPANKTVTFSVEGLPQGITATLTPTGDFEKIYTLNLDVPTQFTPGFYSFRLKAVMNGAVRYLPTALLVGKGAFWTKPIRPVTVAAGQSVTFPVDLGRNDTFYSTASKPLYLNETRLSCEAPAGLTVSFPAENPTDTNTAGMKVAVAAGTAPGTYTLKVKATRNTVVDTQDVTVTVTAASAPRKVSLQKAEWGQSVILSDLRLVDGKAALLRLHLLADAPDVTAAPVTAVVKADGAILGTYTLVGPKDGKVPTLTDSNVLDTTWTATLPADVVKPGMTVEVSYNGNLLDTLTPSVGFGRELDLTVVPIIHNGIAPKLASEATLRHAITSMWPAKGVKLTLRAPYTTSIQIPAPDAPNDVHAEAVIDLLAEVASLRLADRSSSDYYGFVNSGYSWGILGIHQGGWATGIGIDSTKRGEAESMLTFQHELGHGFNLRHSPDGSAGGPTSRFPYANVSIGSVGLDLEKGLLYTPVKGFHDIMSYTDNQWTSDFSYQRTQGYFEALQGVVTPPGARMVAEQQPHTLVTGSITPQGRVTLHPVQHLSTAPRNTRPGDHTLRLRCADGTREVDFQPQQVDCAPEGFRFFTLLIPGHLEIREAQVASHGDLLTRVTPRADYRARVQSAASASFRSLEQLSEEAGTLTLRWDADLHPMVSIAHVATDGQVTTLGLNHRGGTLTLGTQGLPEGGHFRLTYSDGLNPVHRMIAR